MGLPILLNHYAMGFDGEKNTVSIPPNSFELGISTLLETRKCNKNCKTLLKVRLMISLQEQFIQRVAQNINSIKRDQRVIAKTKIC